MKEFIWATIISIVIAFIISLYCECKRTYKNDEEQESWIRERLEKERRKREK